MTRTTAVGDRGDRGAGRWLMTIVAEVRACRKGMVGSIREQIPFLLLAR